MFLMFRQQQSDVPPEIWDDLEKELNKTSMNDLISMLIPVYIKHLSCVSSHWPPFRFNDSKRAETATVHTGEN
jgi:hypothetical protein